jgi:hypothetical protein
MFNQLNLKRLVWFLLACFILCLLAGEFFSYTRPQAPIMSAGRVYPFNEHGTIVYLNFREYLVAGTPTSAVIFVLFVACLLLVKARESGDDRNTKP